MVLHRSGDRGPGPGCAEELAPYDAALLAAGPGRILRTAGRAAVVRFGPAPAADAVRA